MPCFAMAETGGCAASRGFPGRASDRPFALKRRTLCLQCRSFSSERTDRSAHFLYQLHWAQSQRSSLDLGTERHGHIRYVAIQLLD